MKIAIINFTFNGGIINDKLNRKLSESGYICESYTINRLLEKFKFKPMNDSLSEWASRMFKEKDAIIFIGAAGIAVRAISKYIVSKDKDPAVIVVDEKGKFTIPILSGHIGGANNLGVMVSTILNSVPVITTATDVNEKFAVDTFAVKNGMVISDIKMIKVISRAVLEDRKVGLSSDYKVIGKLPEELEVNERLDPLINISVKEDKNTKNTINLIPKILTLGVGCRKNTDSDKIEKMILDTLRDNSISIHSIKKIASIDLKKDEQGIIEFSKKYKIPFETYTSDELNSVKGEFTSSDFVKSITGVNNVCERSAVYGSNNGKLIVKKTARNGVTVAISEEDWSVRFE